MARRNAATDSGTSSGSRLQEPFGSAPSRPGKYAIYARKKAPGESVAAKQLILVAAATYAARHIFDHLIPDGNFKWLNNTTVVTPDGIEVQCAQLEEIVDYDLKGQELDWMLPEPYPRDILRFRGEAIREAEQRREHGDTVPVHPERAHDKPKRERTPRPPRNGAGMVSIAQIAARINMEAREARAILRAANVDKPPQGWEWGTKGADVIERLLKERRKK